MDKWQQEDKPFFFIVDFEKKAPLLFLLDEIQDHEDIWVSFPSFKNHTVNPSSKKIDLDFTPFPFNIYEKQFSEVQKQIYLGNTYLLNLCIETFLKGEYKLEDVFNSANAPYKLKYKDEFCCFSPEPFIKISDDKIFTFPMKGTIDAEMEDASDILMEDKKEKAEHATVVDLLRNDLSLVSYHIKVEKYRYLEKIESNNGSIWQTSSKIKGTLLPKYKKSIGSILRNLLPAGSISGAPKEKTVDIINEVETQKRGYYTGVMGVCNGCEVESAVMIRFLRKENNQYIYQSGGGITYMSKLQDEYDELQKKIYVPIF